MIPSVVSALLAFIAALFRSRASLHLEHFALRHQLAVYQRSVPRPRLRAIDRLFWAWLSRLWSDWQSALAFVQPRAVIIWQRQCFRDHWRQLSQQGTPGRPTIAKDVRDLIRTMWQTNPTWGAPRIVGELRKLGIDVAKSTVEKYRLRPRKPSSPTWKSFLQNHVQDLIAMDFLVVPSVTHKILFVFVVLAQGRASEQVAASTGYSVKWIRTMAQRYNQYGPTGLEDPRHHNPGHPGLLSAGQRAALATALEHPPPDGGLWTGPKVAAWMAATLGHSVHPQRGWDMLQRLGLRQAGPPGMRWRGLACQSPGAGTGRHPPAGVAALLAGVAAGRTSLAFDQRSASQPPLPGS